MSIKTFFPLIICWDESNSQAVESGIRKVYGNSSLIKLQLNWKKSDIKSHLRRLYGWEVKEIEQKSKTIANDNICCWIIQDKNPQFKLLKTNTGLRSVDEKSTLLKQYLRKKLGLQWGIHSADSIKESKKQISLLIGNTYDDLNKIFSQSTGEIIKINNSGLFGACASWPSLETFLKVITNTDQAVLAFEPFAPKRNHILLLVDNYAETCLFCGNTIESIFIESNIVNTTINLDGIMWNLQLLDADLLDISKSKFEEIMKSSGKNQSQISILSQEKLLELHQLLAVSGIKLSLEDKRIYSLDESSPLDSLTLTNSAKLAFRRDSKENLLYTSTRSQGVNSSIALQLTSKKFQLMNLASTLSEVRRVRYSDIEHQDNIKSMLINNKKYVHNIVAYAQKKLKPVYHKITQAGGFESQLYHIELPVCGSLTHFSLKIEKFFDPKLAAFALRDQHPLHEIVDHPCIPFLYFRQIDKVNSTLITISEWRDGRSLHDLFVGVSKGEKIPSFALISILNALSSYIKRISSLGYSHRDIWEKNIIIGQEGISVVDYTNSIHKHDKNKYFHHNSKFQDDTKSFYRLERLFYKLNPLGAFDNIVRFQDKYPRVNSSTFADKLLESIHSVQENVKFSLQNLVFSGSSVLALCGLRANRDIDVMHPTFIDKNTLPSGFNSHNFQLRYLDMNGPWELFFNPQALIRHENILFLDPYYLLKLKVNRLKIEKRKKDFADIAILREFLSS